jgi:hypothetical protein
VIWGVLLYFLRAHASPDEWPLYLIFVVLPFPLFFPVYNRYRKGIKYSAKDRTPRYHLTWAILSVGLSGLYVLDAFHRRSWDRMFYLAIAMMWLLFAADHFRRWAKARENLPDSGPR